MPVFRPDTKTVRIKGASSFATTLVLTVIYFTLRIAFELIWYGDIGSEDLKRFIFSTLAWSFVSASFTVFYSKMQLREYELSVDENEIRVKSTFFGRSIRRGQIRTMIERPHGLLVSSRGKIGTFLWGGLLITRMLPEYEEMKGLVEKWKSPA